MHVLYACKRVIKEIARYKNEKKIRRGAGQRESLWRALDRSLGGVLARRRFRACVRAVGLGVLGEGKRHALSLLKKRKLHICINIDKNNRNDFIS